MKPKTPKHKTYTVHKKPAKKAEWKTIGEVLKATPVPSQLDRIERKLDELLSRLAVTPPGLWVVPRTYPCDPMPIGPVDPSWPTTRTDRPPRWPVGYWGESIPYA